MKPRPETGYSPDSVPRVTPSCERAFRVLPQFATLVPPFEQRQVGANDPPGGVSIFVEQLEAKVAQAGFREFTEVAGAGLRDGIEKRVPAANIGSQWVLDADPIAERNAMPIARSAAIQMR